jgi:reverse gyrase
MPEYEEQWEQTIMADAYEEDRAADEYNREIAKQEAAEIAKQQGEEYLLGLLADIRPYIQVPAMRVSRVYCGTQHEPSWDTLAKIDEALKARTQ